MNATAVIYNNASGRRSSVVGVPRAAGHPASSDLIDVREAAARVGRHPETIRRWVWSGRIAARRDGNRLLVRVADVEALAGTSRGAAADLAAWSARAHALRTTVGDRAAHAGADAAHAGATAADLVLEDRSRRSGSAEPDAGR